MRRQRQRVFLTGPAVPVRAVKTYVKNATMRRVSSREAASVQTARTTIDSKGTGSSFTRTDRRAGKVPTSMGIKMERRATRESKGTVARERGCSGTRTGRSGRRRRISTTREHREHIGMRMATCHRHRRGRGNSPRSECRSATCRLPAEPQLPDAGRHRPQAHIRTAKWTRSHRVIRSLEPAAPLTSRFSICLSWRQR